MKKFKLSVKRYRDKELAKKEAELGFLDDEAKEDVEKIVKRYAIARQKHKAGLQDFNVFTEDPKCTTCRKNKGDK